MKKIKLFDENSLVLESELGKGLSVASSSAVGGVYTFPAKDATFLDNSYLVIKYNGAWYVFPKSVRNQMIIYIPLNGGSSSIYFPANVVKSSTTFELRKNVGGNTSPVSFNGTTATFASGTTATFSGNTTITVNSTGDTVGAVLAIALTMGSQYHDMAVVSGVRAGKSYAWGVREDDKGVTIPATSINNSSAMYLLPSMFTQTTNVGGVVAVTGQSGMRVLLVAEHSSYQATHAVFCEGATSEETTPPTYSVKLYGPSVQVRLIGDNIISNYSSNMSRTEYAGFEDYVGAEGMIHVAYNETGTHGVLPKLRLNLTSNYGLFSLQGLSYTDTDVSPAGTELPHFVVPPKDMDATEAIKSVATATDDSLIFPTTSKVGDAITIKFPKASAGNATNGGLITSTEFNVIMSALGTLDTTKIDTVQVAYSDTLTGPTTTIVGDTLTITFPKASGGNATNGGLITSLEYTALTNKVSSVSVVIDNTLTGPQITWVGKTATLRIPLTSSGASLGGLVTASEWQAIWDTIGSPTATPTWAGTVSYGLGNKVLFRGVVWECIQAHLSSTFDADLENWRISGEKGIVYSQPNTFSILTPVKVTSTGVTKAKSDTASTLSDPPCIVVAVNANFVAVVWGVARINIPHGKTVDTTYYVSTVAGEVTSGMPTTGIVNPVYYTLDANNLLVLASPAWER